MPVAPSHPPTLRHPPIRPRPGARGQAVDGRWLLRGLSQGLLCGLVPVLAGCALLNPTPEADTAADPTTGPAAYDLEIDAPSDLTRLLATHLDLARFQKLPAADAINPTDLNRLVQAAPAQAKALLETEGHFNPKVRVTKQAATGGGLPSVTVTVEPGPRTRVAETDLTLTGALQQAVQAGEPRASDLAQRLRQKWPLDPGTTFRQAAWGEAKTSTLGAVRADGYPAASWADTRAEVDAPANRAKLTLTLDSGPLFRFGATTVEGLQRYQARAVQNLATYQPGTPYTEKRMLDFQERLQRANLFESAVLEINPDPAVADATPVTVRVRELPKNQAELGVGYSDSTGQRISIEHTNRRLFDRSFFGTDLTARNKLELGRDRQSLETDLTTHPLAGGWRNLVAARLQREVREGSTVRSARLRAGRAIESERVDRLFFVEGTSAATQSTDASVADRLDRAVTANVHVTLRRLDSVLLPTQGYALHGELGSGYAFSNVSGNGPFTRAFGRLNAYRPLGSGWLGSARLEAGQVFARSNIGVPDTLLFRAGGDESVRGYAYQSLGPVVNGTVTSGRALLTASVEAAHPLLPSVPALLGAVFVDAGAAAQDFGQLNPVLGYGVGVRFRSPVGPLRLDLAYANELQQFRLHFGVGVTF